MSTKKKVAPLNKDTVFSVKLKKKHPRHKMYLNGVLIHGYAFKNYKLPKGTDLSQPEIEAWFEVQKEIAGQPVEDGSEKLLEDTVDTDTDDIDADVIDGNGEDNEDGE